MKLVNFLKGCIFVLIALPGLFDQAQEEERQQKGLE
jgi:hypothetical protein